MKERTLTVEWELMDPGTRQIEVIRGDLKGLKVRSVYDMH